MIVITRQQFIDILKPHDDGVPLDDTRNQFEAMAWAGYFVFLEPFEANDLERDILNEILGWCGTNCHGRFGPLTRVSVGFEQERDMILCRMFYG